MSVMKVRPAWSTMALGAAAVLITCWAARTADLTLSPSLVDAAPLDATFLNVAAPAPQGAFDLDLARLYRMGAQPRRDLERTLAADPRQTGLATWDLPLAVTLARRTLSAALEQRADTALAAQIALLAPSDRLR